MSGDLLSEAGGAELRPDQMAYFDHLISSWYGWRVGTTGFIMPRGYWRREIVRRLRKAVNATLRNRP